MMKGPLGVLHYFYCFFFSNVEIIPIVATLIEKTIPNPSKRKQPIMPAAALKKPYQIALIITISFLSCNL